jgi:dUTP pyrophosphatase
MEIKVKKLHKDAVIPKFMNIGDAGADLTATSIEFKNDLIIYGIGLAFEIPQGYCMKIYPRSSIFKYNLELVNSVGVIDSQYRCEVKFIFRMPRYDNLLHEVCIYNQFANEKLEPSEYLSQYWGNTIYKIGDRIGQAIIEKLINTNYVEVEELNMNNDRGGGFGSTN